MSEWFVLAFNSPFARVTHRSRLPSRRFALGLDDGGSYVALTGWHIRACP